MTPFSISGLLAGIFSLAFGFFVFFKSQDRKLARIWFLFALSATGWGFGSFWIGMPNNGASDFTPWYFAYGCGVIWIAPLFYHFVCVYLERKDSLIRINYIIAFLFLILLPTRYFFKELKLFFNVNYFAMGGPLYPSFFTWWIGLIIYSHLKLVLAYRKVEERRKIQIKYFFIATAIGFMGGALCYFPSFGIEIYPYGNFCVFIYPIIMSYAILKYNLMDIKILIRRAAFLTLIYLLLLVITAPIFVHVYSKISLAKEIFPSILLTEMILIISILSLGPFIYAYLVKKSAYFHEHTIAGLTHELKSPLGVIDSATSALLDDLKSSNFDRHKIIDYLTMIQNNTSRLQNFAQNIIHVAKGQDDIIELDSKPIDLADLYESAVTHWRTSPERKGVSIEYQGPTHAPLVEDAVKLHQVISNLLSNAVKFSDHGVIQVKLSMGEKEWLTSVSDEGCGIAPENQKKVFQKFFQERPGFKGTGIGLTIAKAWVEAHGGKIWAESGGGGKGTTIHFSLST